MLSPQTTLSFFAILAISSITIFVAKKLKLPHTVFLVIVGALLGALSFIPSLEFIQHIELTPTLLFYLLLPTLIFESAFAISARKLAENTVIITLLSVLSLVISALIIAVLLSFFFSLIGLQIPFMLLLLFGSLISATDPVAVLALFKEYGAPERLSLIFEGESLFNDATSVAFFLIVLGIIVHGFSGSTTLVVGIGQFVFMMFGGIVFGIIMGLLFAGLVGLVRESEVASITLTIALAHLTFIISDVISHEIHFWGHEFPISPIIATTIASLVMGNYGRAKIHPSAEPFVTRLWSQLAFMANTVIFVLIGLLVVRSEVFASAELLIPIAISIIVVAFSRALSIYPITFAFNLFAKKEDGVPLSWSHLLSWGSLRGALAITMVLLVPEDLTLPNWPMSITPQEFLLALTLGCICATLFLKATTIRQFMKYLGLDKRSRLEEYEYLEARALIHEEVSNKVQQYFERGYISEVSCASIKQLHKGAEADAENTISKLKSSTEAKTVDQVLRMYAIGIEIAHLKELYRFEEVTESVYRRIIAKLTLQLEALEHSDIAPHSSIHTSGHDIFERLYYRIKNFFVRPTETKEIVDKYLYYRAQSIVSRKVLKVLERLGVENAQKIFSREPVGKVIELYTTYKQQSGAKAEAIRNAHPELIDPLNHTLALRGANKVASITRENLEEKLLITKNVSITLGEELEMMHQA